MKNDTIFIKKYLKFHYSMTDLLCLLKFPKYILHKENYLDSEVLSWKNKNNEPNKANRIVVFLYLLIKKAQKKI